MDANLRIDQADSNVSFSLKLIFVLSCRRHSQISLSASRGSLLAVIVALLLHVAVKEISFSLLFLLYVDVVRLSVLFVVKSLDKMMV